MTHVTADDRSRLSDLVSRYALHVDERDLDGAAGLFCPDGVLVLPDLPGSLRPTVEHVGAAAIRAALSAVERVPQTFHAVVGEVYDAGPGPGLLRGTVACEAHHLTENGPGEVVDRVWHLRYRDTYREAGDGWRFARRELHLASIEIRPVRAWLGSATT
jgi:ketosteroid isomerase-like protein